MVRVVIHKWTKQGTVVNLPWNGWTSNVSSRAHQLIHEVTEELKHISPPVSQAVSGFKKIKDKIKKDTG